VRRQGEEVKKFGRDRKHNSKIQKREVGRIRKKESEQNETKEIVEKVDNALGM